MKKETETWKSWMSRFGTLKTNEERAQFSDEFKAFLASIPDEMKPTYKKVINDSVESTIQEADEVIAILKANKLKKQLETILPYITLSQIAKSYFNKSRHWLYARINGNIINGKPVKFTDEELKILSDALQDISEKLLYVSKSIA